MQRVIKRDGREVDFNKEKIIKAISCANQEVIKSKQIGPRKINQLANIVEEKCSLYKRAIKVEDINDLIEDELIYRNYNNLVRAFIQYRYNKELVRKSNTTDDSILSLINLSNEELKQENSNKNPVISSTQRDYMAGEVSKDLARRLLLPKDIVKAHDEGIIHFHDMDYFAQRIHNCFLGSTTFVTNSGVRSFDSFNDGDTVNVRDKYGILRSAVVKKYAKQEMNKLTLVYKGSTHKEIKEVICTPNHRWILQDGTITTHIKAGDRLCLVEKPTESSINTYNEARAFCLGFILGDSLDLKNDHVVVKLANENLKYNYIFNMAGFTKCNLSNKEVCYSIKNYPDQDFLSVCGWRCLTTKQKVLLFRGLYAAAGSTYKSFMTTTDDGICQLIDELADISGYYILTKKSIIVGDNKLLTSYQFITKTAHNKGWKVKKVEKYMSGELQDTWCVEERITRSFTLSNGVITGNCDLVNLEDMLQNGTVISGTLIEKPHSFSTACNVATQVVAQVASSQYGGQSITLSHLAPFVDISRQKIRAELLEEQKYLNNKLAEAEINIITEKRLRKEVKRGVQTIQYQVNTLMTTNGQAPFITVFMYLGEVLEEQTKKDLALIIEEVLMQRYTGTKNEKGVWITPAFPKLIYVLEEDNIHETSPYYYLTELAAKCTAKRMVPDYISEKIMIACKYGIDAETGLVLPDYQDIFRESMLKCSYTKEEIDKQIELELNGGV